MVQETILAAVLITQHKTYCLKMQACSLRLDESRRSGVDLGRERGPDPCGIRLT